MIQKLSLWGLGVSAGMALTACSGAPSCGDEEVLQLITEIYQDQLRDRYAATGVWNVTYADIARDARTDPKFQIVLDEIEEDVRNSRIEISAVRTLGTDSGLSQSQCACAIAVHYFQGRGYGLESHLQMRVANINFEYTAQYSDDGAELYVQGREI